MKTTWQTKKLGDLCSIELGKTPSRGNIKYWDKEKQTQNVWLSIADLLHTQGNTVSDSKEYISNSGAKLSKIVKKGTLLASFKLTLGRLAFAGKDLYTNEAIAALSVKNKEELASEYLYYYLTFFDWHGAVKGDVKIKGKTLNKAKLKMLDVLLPPLSEQNRIAKLLDKVFTELMAAKIAAEKNLQNAQKLFEAYLENVFTNASNAWEENVLGNVCEISSKLIDPRDEKYIDLIHVGAGNIETKSGKLIDLKTAKEEKLISGKFLFNKKMVLYSKIRPYLMKVVRPDFDGLCSADIYPILPNESVLNRDFLYYLLLTSKFTKYAILGSGRAGMPKVNREHLFAYSLLLPPLSEQRTIVRNLDTLAIETKKLEAIYEKKLSNLEELKTSVLRMIFSGELPPVLSPTQVAVAPVAAPSPYIRNQVHAAILEQVVQDGGVTTEVAVAKYDHLLQELFGVSLGYQFATHQFGPFDAKIKSLVSSGLSPRNKWFTKRGGMIVFGSNVGALLSRQSNLYHAAQASMKELSRLGITKLDADGIELFSTVCHSIKETGSVAIDVIRTFMSNWQTDNNARTKAEKFSEERTQKCLDFILKNNLQQKLLPTT